MTEVTDQGWYRKSISKQAIRSSPHKQLQKSIDSRISVINAHIVHNDLVRGKIIFKDGEIQEGDFFSYPKGFSILNGTVILPEGGENPKMIRGKFSKRTGRFIEGQIIYDCEIHEGIFDRDEGTLTNGRIFEMDTGNIYDGEFDRDLNLVKGKIIYGPKEKHVIYKEGVFDIDTENLIQGKILYADGQLEEGQFDKSGRKDPVVFDKRPTNRGGMVFDKDSGLLVKWKNAQKKRKNNQ